MFLPVTLDLPYTQPPAIIERVTLSEQQTPNPSPVLERIIDDLIAQKPSVLELDTPYFTETFTLPADLQYSSEKFSHTPYLKPSHLGRGFMPSRHTVKNSYDSRKRQKKEVPRVDVASRRRNNHNNTVIYNGSKVQFPLRGGNHYANL